MNKRKQMVYTFLTKKIKPFMNEEATNKEIVKFCQSKFENRIQRKKFESLFKKYFHYNKQVVCLQVED